MDWFEVLPLAFVAVGVLLAAIGLLRHTSARRDRVRVLYDLDEPARARLTRSAAPTIVGIGQIVFGTAFALFGAGFYLLIRAMDLPN